MADWLSTHYLPPNHRDALRFLEEARGAALQLHAEGRNRVLSLFAQLDPASAWEDDELAAYVAHVMGFNPTWEFVAGAWALRLEPA